MDLVYTLLFYCMCLCFCEGELRCFLSYLCSCQSLFHVLNYHAGGHLSIIGLAAGRNIVLVNNQAHNSIWCYKEWMGGIYVCWYTMVIQAWPPFLLSERSCQQTTCDPQTLNWGSAKSKLNQVILQNQNGSLSLSKLNQLSFWKVYVTYNRLYGSA